MNTIKGMATYRRLRDEPLWRLLAAKNAPIIIALLQAHLMGEDRTLPASVLYERLSKDLDTFRAHGEDLPQTAQAYVANWLADGYLSRRFPTGSDEEVYELTAAAAGAIRMAEGLVDSRTTATESRLSTVIQQLMRLAEETDANPETRVATLLAERERIDREIEAVRSGVLTALPEERALERAREIIALAGELNGDFRNVRDKFEHLNRELRERLLDNDGKRGAVLDDLFSGVDVIAESEAGRTFYAFWKLLTDPEQSTTLDGAIEEVLARSFAAQLDSRERRFMERLIMTLLEQGGMVHEVLQHFARSLKQFVQSREYQEQRRMNYLLKEAQRAALSLKDEVQMARDLKYDLPLTSSSIRSFSQWVLYDPALSAVAKGMAAGDAPLLDLGLLGELVAQSEIDFRSLKLNIQGILRQEAQVTVGQLMALYPVPQGLGTVVGYLALRSRHGVMLNGESETISWQGGDDMWRIGQIPLVCFLAENIHELE